MGDFDRRGKHDEITISTEVRLPGCKIFFLFSSTTIKDQLVLTILTSPLSYPAARTLPSPFWSLPTATAHASLRWESEEGCMQAVGLSGHLRSHTLTLPSLEAVATSGGPTPSPSPAMPSTAFTRSSCARRMLTGWEKRGRTIATGYTLRIIVSNVHHLCTWQNHILKMGWKTSRANARSGE